MTPIAAAANFQMKAGRVFASFFLANAFICAAKIYTSAKKFFQDRSLENGKNLFTDTLNECATTVSGLYWAHTVQWIHCPIPMNVERFVNFSSFLIRTGLGDHPLRPAAPENDLHPLVRLAYEVTTVVYAALELILLCHALPGLGIIKNVILISSFVFLGLGIYYSSNEAQSPAST